MTLTVAMWSLIVAEQKPMTIANSKIGRRRLKVDHHGPPTLLDNIYRQTHLSSRHRRLARINNAIARLITMVHTLPNKSRDVLMMARVVPPMRPTVEMSVTYAGFRHEATIGHIVRITTRMTLCLPIRDRKMTPIAARITVCVGNIEQGPR